VKQLKARDLISSSNIIISIDIIIGWNTATSKASKRLQLRCGCSANCVPHVCLPCKIPSCYPVNALENPHENLETVSRILFAFVRVCLWVSVGASENSRAIVALRNSAWEKTVSMSKKEFESVSARSSVRQPFDQWLCFSAVGLVRMLGRFQYGRWWRALRPASA
jgi:hypothetical protein